MEILRHSTWYACQWDVHLDRISFSFEFSSSILGWRVWEIVKDLSLWCHELPLLEGKNKKDLAWKMEPLEKRRSRWWWRSSVCPDDPCWNLVLVSSCTRGTKNLKVTHLQLNSPVHCLLRWHSLHIIINTLYIIYITVTGGVKKTDKQMQNANMHKQNPSYEIKSCHMNNGWMDGWVGSNLWRKTCWD